MSEKHTKSAGENAPESSMIEPETGTLEGLDTVWKDLELASLRILDSAENARFMPASQFNQLVANLKRDGVLTSGILVYLPEGLDETDPKMVRTDAPLVLSGNHRAQAGIKAGIKLAHCQIIRTPLTMSRMRAIQLSHNAIAGKDDPSLLGQLYAGLDFGEKTYSGITEDMLVGAQNIDLTALSVGSMQQQDVLLTFLPEQQDAFLKLLKEVQGKSSKRRVIAVGRAEDFDSLFETVIRTKEVTNVLNTSAAFSMMAKLANERLDQLEAAEAAKTSPSPEPVPTSEVTPAPEAAE